MAAFSLHVVGFLGCSKVKSPTQSLRIVAKTAKFQILVPPTDMARWSIRTGRAIRQMRQTQRVKVQLFVHREWF